MSETVVESSAGVVVDSNEKIRVLHVDDDSGFLETTKHCLELQTSIQVDTALSVEEAFKKMENEKFDIIVSDFQMPTKDGMDFLKELREKDISIPFVVFTGKGREEVAIKALNLGANQYLNKTGDAETVYTELAHCVIELVRARKAEEALRCSEEKYRILFENSKDLKVMFDLSGNIMAVNKVALEYGFKTGEGVGKNMLDYVPKTDYQQMQKNVEEISRGKTIEGEIEIETPTGKRVFEHISSPIKQKDVIIGICGSYKDITERKKMEEENREAAMKYKDLANSLPEIVFEADSQGKLTFVNQKAFELSGYSQQDFEKSMSIFDFLAPEEHEKAKENFRRRMQGESGQGTEYLFQRKDGNTYPVLVNSEPIFKESTIVGIRGIAINISSLKENEKALYQAEEKFKAIFENGFDAATYVDTNGKILDVNKQIEELLGSKREQIIGKRFDEIGLVNPARLPQLLMLFSETVQRGVAQGITETELIRKNGEKFPVEVSTRFIKDSDGKVTEIVNTFRDITERKKSEQKLIQSDMIFENSPDLLCIVGFDGYFKAVNPAWTASLGWSKEELLAKNWIEFLHPEEREATARMIPQIISEKITQLRRRHICKDGTTKWLSGNSTPYPERNELFVVLRDETEHVKAEENLKKSHEQLEIVNQKLNVVGSLTRHDVANKLAVAKANIYLLKKKMKDEPELKKYVDAVDEALNQSKKIFEFSSIYEKIGAEKPENTNVADSFDEAFGLIPHTGIEIVNTAQGLTVLADSMLRQLFYNLIDNSLKHGKTVRKIQLSCTQNDREAKLTYEDDGVGIPQGDKSKIFLESFTTGGSGLGLKLVKRMIEVYGWTITEEGEPGKGAKFVITIPPSKRS